MSINFVFKAPGGTMLRGVRLNTTALPCCAGNYAKRNVVPSERGRLVCIEIAPGKHLKKKKKTRRGRRVIYIRRNHGLLITTTSGMFDFRKDAVAVAAKTR